MKPSFLLSLFSVVLSATAVEVTQPFDVKLFGAVGDHKTLDTVAIQKAIDSANAAGGGAVYFPTGDFLSGTLILKSNVTLHLTPGATLWGSTQMTDYNPKHLIYATNVQNVAIEGEGTIDGQGDAFFDRELKPLPRPSPLIELWGTRGIRIEGVTIRKAPAWTIHPKNCEDVKIRGLSILNNLHAVNSDGIDVDSSRNVIISDCHIEAGDDCIVLKTTQRGDGPVSMTENVVVTNCVLVSAASALKLGTESHGDFRHVLFSNCVIRDSRTGIALLAKDGGAMEDVRFLNITMTTQPKWNQGLEWPIVVDIEKRTTESRLSHIRDVCFNGLTVCTKGRILAEGMPDSPIENLSFRDVLVHVTGYEKIEGAKKMHGGSATVAANAPDYGATPAAMIFAHVKGLSLEGITIIWPPRVDASARHAVYGDDLSGESITGFRGAASVPGLKAINLENSTEAMP